MATTYEDLLSPILGSSVALATAVSPGAAPNWPPMLDQIGIDSLAVGVVPAFVANAASIAPGTDKACYYPIGVDIELDGASELTIDTTDMPAYGVDVLLLCHALALGYVLTVHNGGPADNDLGTFAASMTKPQVMRLYWDGTNFMFSSQNWINP